MTVIYDRDQARQDRRNRRIARCRFQVHKPQYKKRLISVHRTQLAAYLAVAWWMIWFAVEGDRRVNFQIIDTKEDE